MPLKIPVPVDEVENSKTEHRNIYSRNKRKSSANKAVYGTFYLVRVVIQNFLKKPVISTVFKADE